MLFIGAQRGAGLAFSVSRESSAVICKPLQGGRGSAPG